MSEPKQFWILHREFSADIVFDRGPIFGEKDQTHVIEYKAYQELKDKLKKSEAESIRVGLIFTEAISSISKENEALKLCIENLEADNRAYLIDAQEPTERSQEAAHYNWLDDQNEKLKAENEALKSRIEKLRAALEFYASTINWNNLLNYNNNMIRIDDLELMERIVEDADCSEWVGGKTARDALRKIEGE